MRRKFFPVLTLILAFLLPHTAIAWDAVGHQLVARIAWENMNPTARRKVIEILEGAPPDACLSDLFPRGSGALEVRQREFFVKASTWPDIVRPDTRPGVVDRRPCIRFHRGSFHFINFLWKGISGATNNSRPRDLTEDELRAIPPPDVNAVVQLNFFRSSLLCTGPQCDTPAQERATQLAWILHLVGDIHQPLHTSARVTRKEPAGDRGGNLFLLDGKKPLHGFWDGIVKNVLPKASNEKDMEHIERVARGIMLEHPRSQMTSRLQSIDFEAWAREGLVMTKRAVYPRQLVRGTRPKEEYRQSAFTISKEAIAIGGYRLADLLNRIFGS